MSKLNALLIKRFKSSIPADVFEKYKALEYRVSLSCDEAYEELKAYIETREDRPARIIEERNAGFVCVTYGNWSRAFDNKEEAIDWLERSAITYEEK